VRKQGVRVNGFQAPLNPYQISSWIVCAYEVITFYAVDIVSLSHSPGVAWPAALVFGAICLLVLYYGIKATRCDPSDPTIRAQIIAEAKGEKFNQAAYEYECEICETSVTDTAKHCGACNRCVHDFDHHCRWLNNCVGKANYDDFFKLIILTFLMSLMHILTDIAVLYHFYVETTEVEETHRSLYGSIMFFQFKIMLFIASVFNMCVCIFLGHLTVFHIMLKNRKMTTFEYIRWK